MSNKSKNKIVIKLLTTSIKIIITIILLYIVLQNINYNEVISLFKNMLLALLIIILLNFISFTIMAQKWWILIKKFTNKSFKRIFLIYWASDFASLFLPGFIGSELYKLYISKDKKAIITTSLFDRFFSIIIYTLLALVAFLIYYQKASPSLLITLTLLIIITIVITYSKIIKYIQKKTKLKFLKILTFRRKTLKTHIFLSILYIISVGLRVWVIFFFLGYNLTIDFALLLSALVVVAVSLPITYQGFGAREAVFVFASNSINISTETAIVASLMYYFANLSYRILGSIPFSLLKKEITSKQ